MKSLGWLVTLALAAAAVALVAAPLVVRSLVVAGGEWAPAWPLRVASLVGYEGVLWCTGVGAFALARRLGWLDARWHGLLLTLAAPAAETAVALTLGRLPPGLSTAPGVIVRLLVAAVAVTVVVRLGRRRLPA